MSYIDVDSLPDWSPGEKITAADLNAWYTAFSDALGALTSRNLRSPLVIEGTIDLNKQGEAVNHGIINSANILEDMISATENGVPNSGTSDAADPLQDLIEYVYAQGGGTILLAPGTYRMDNSRDFWGTEVHNILRPAVHLLGCGSRRTKIIMRGNTQDHVCMAIDGRLTEDAQSAGSVAGIQFIYDALPSGSTSNFLLTGTGRYGLIRDCEFFGSNDNRARGLIFTQAGEYGVHGWTVRNCRFDELSLGVLFHKLTSYVNFMDSAIYRTREPIVFGNVNHINVHNLLLDGIMPNGNAWNGIAFSSVGGAGSHSITVHGSTIVHRMKEKAAISGGVTRGIVAHNVIDKDLYPEDLGAKNAISMGSLSTDEPVSLVIGGNMIRLRKFSDQSTATRYCIRIYPDNNGAVYVCIVGNEVASVPIVGPSPPIDTTGADDAKLYANMDFTST